MAKKFNATSFEEYFALPNAGLRAYFSLVRRGQSTVFDTPFAKGESTSQLLDAWFEHLETIRHKWPTLWEFENDLASKVGPMSVMAPLEDRMKDIDSYYSDILIPSEPIDPRAVAAVVQEFGAVRGLRMRNQSHTLLEMKQSSNSGNPYFTRRSNVAGKVLPVKVCPEAGEVYQHLGERHELWKSCAVLGWRGQEGGYSKNDVKQRVVWMFPFGVNIEELQVYQPLIEAAQNFQLVPAWVGMDLVDQKITNMFDSKGHKDLVVCTDFSRFDQHFNRSLQDAARQVLTALLTPSTQSYIWLREVFPVKYMIPLAYDFGKIRKGKHGMASGSGGTNADETLAHRCLQYEASMLNDALLNPNSQCLGDDGVLTYPGITVEDVVDAYTAHGLEMNGSKQYASTQDCVYLRRWHHTDYRIGGICRGVYSTARALGRLRYLERYYDPEVWGPRMVALRQLSIIENVKWHPLKVEFAQFCMKRDKYRLGLDLPGFLDNIEAVAREAIELIPDFLGYTKTLQGGIDQIGGIRNWWIVRYLKSLA